LQGHRCEVRRRRRARQIKDRVERRVEPGQRSGDVVFDHRELFVGCEVFDVRPSTRDEVVDDHDLVAAFEEEFGEVGADEATTTCQ
jgi:hypothetical protein